MIAGFTGTQEGMTEAQITTVTGLLSSLGLTGIRHGDCIGADGDLHSIAVKLGIPVAIHPPTNPSKRAWKIGSKLYPPKPYLDRNKDIVDRSALLIACPKGPEEVRSGTWSTVRYARKMRKRVVIVFPDGSMLSEGSL